ncbi:hypothetical protein [Micromonospora zamorensis]|uniref:hypothetical protein n=1 Tax=Micromonospora zamorensis TaxID=709883 RepID=UPI003790F647
MPLRLLLDGDVDGVLPDDHCLSPGQVALVRVRDLDPAEVEYVLNEVLGALGLTGARPTDRAQCPG